MKDFSEKRRVANSEWMRDGMHPTATHYSLLPIRYSLLLQPFHNRHIGHAAAFAHGLQAVALVALLERIDERRHQFGAGAAKRMAERDRAAIDVEPLGVGAGGFEPRRRYRGKGLVDLEQVVVIDRQAGLLPRASVR